MKPESVSTQSVSIRIDTRSQSIISYLRARLPEAKLTNASLFRRALAVYLEHVDKLINSPDLLELESLKLSHAVNPDCPPWRVNPDFTRDSTKPFDAYIKDNNKKRGTEKLLKSNPEWKLKQ